MAVTATEQAFCRCPSAISQIAFGPTLSLANSLVWAADSLVGAILLVDGLVITNAAKKLPRQTFAETSAKALDLIKPGTEVGAKVGKATLSRVSRRCNTSSTVYFK
jgi:hypothetical protein